MHNRAPEDRSPSLDHDDWHGVRLLTEHLVELGHQKIAFLGNVRGGRLTAPRVGGYRESLSDAGLTVRDEPVVAASNGEPTGGANAIAEAQADSA